MIRFRRVAQLPLLLGLTAGCCLVLIVSVASAADTAPRAFIDTKFGTIEIRFFPDVAPKHVENFIALAKKGFYDGTIFHRVIPGFMIQGGDPNTKDKEQTNLYGMGNPGYTVKAEFNDKPHVRGVVSMARSQDPDSAGSQFFIVVQDSTFLDRKYTVFGEVVNGMNVADKIVSQQRDRRDNPLDRIEMKVRIANAQDSEPATQQKAKDKSKS